MSLMLSDSLRNCWTQTTESWIARPVSYSLNHEVRSKYRTNILSVAHFTTWGGSTTYITLPMPLPVNVLHSLLFSTDAQICSWF